MFFLIIIFNFLLLGESSNKTQKTTHTKKMKWVAFYLFKLYFFVCVFFILVFFSLFFVCFLFSVSFVFCLYFYLLIIGGMFIKQKSEKKYALKLNKLLFIFQMLFFCISFFSFLFFCCFYCCLCFFFMIFAWWFPH